MEEQLISTKLRILTPSEGMALTNNKDVWTTGSVFLGNQDNITNWKEITLKEYEKYKNKEIVSFLDFDKEMENYLLEIRTQRGYTTREPTDYINSTNERWKQDAIDWIQFRDAVISYTQNIINDNTIYTNILLDEFKANLPVITWTFND